MSTDRLSVAGVLEQIAGFLELRGENPFRVRAFRNAAKAVLGLPGSVAEALADGSLATTRGIGPATLAIITELLGSGRSGYLEELRQEVPAGLLDLMGVPGLGATRVRLLHQRLGIASLDALEAAARDGSLARLSGFGEKSAAKLLKGIAFARGSRTFRLAPQAAQEAELLRCALERLPGVSRAVVAGEVRRRCEVVGELAFVILTDLPAADLLQPLAGLPGLAEVSAPAPDRLTFRAVGGAVASVRLAVASQFGAALLRATGAESHLTLLAAHAEQRGFVLGAGALTRAGAAIPAPDEAALYRALGLAEVPPELREGADEVTRAARGTLPRLLERADLAGLIHCHTTYSDGTLSVADMTAAARDAGYSYIGITDHSKAAAYAGGLDADRVRLQWAEIAALNAKAGIPALRGIEADILVDGSLDYDDATLAGFDFVIGSIHSRFSLGAAEMTARVLRALDCPYLTILGHPTGRLLLSRNAYPLDLEQVFARAATNGVALEINGDPHRLDLDWRLVRRAREVGVMICIGADAHDREGIAYLEFGIAMARKAGLERQDVLNTRPVGEFLAFARARRPR
ncbi:MAG TPA: PHP domain-containing protein [Gemmatimonadales bacterium]